MADLGDHQPEAKGSWFLRVAGRRRPGRRPRHHRLAPRATTTATRSPGRRSAGTLTQPRAGRPRNRRSDRSPPTSGSKPRCPTRPGSPTSPTTGSPTRHRHVEIITWLDDCTRYALHVTAHRRVTDRHRQARPSAKPLAQHGIPASTLTDNGMVYTVRLAGGRGGTQQLRGRAQATGTSSRRTPDPGTPPPAGRSRRFQQTMKKWLPRQTRPAGHRSPSCRPCSTPSSTPTTTGGPTGHCRTGQPRRPLLRHDAQSRPRRGHRDPDTHDRDPPRHASTKPDRSPCATTAGCTTSASAEPTPEPASSCSSKTSHITRRQRRHRRTPPRADPRPTAATTSPPEPPKDPPEELRNEQQPDLQLQVRLSPMS